jgi:hypothetical protein
MVHAQRHGLRRLQETPRPFGEFLEVHGSPLCDSWMGCSVAPARHNGADRVIRRIRATLVAVKVDRQTRRIA